MTLHPPLPQFRRRLALLAALSLAFAAIAASYAYARTRAASIGTGVVVIDTSLGYQGAVAAGTGMVLTSSGEILTNNHVIRGATTIKIVVPGTGRTYSAKVVGYDVTGDVAIVQATGASNLKTVSLGSSTGLTVGETVRAVGNAGGGGTLVSSTGTITGIARTITVDDETGEAVTLRNLLETNAGLEPGDSGGPLLNAAGKVVGMDTAATVGSGYQDVASGDGYAIPINRVLSVVKLIVAGKPSATVHIGSTAFLGVSMESTQEGAVVAAVVTGGPADAAGLTQGDVITAINGTSITSAAQVGSFVLAQKPGATITVGFVDTDGTNQTARVKLGSGPPQ